MRQSPNQKRSRGRSSGRKGGGHPANRTFESNGPSSKLRGNASQLYEKYQNLARDAGSAGDRVSSENYLQHAEHYYRLMLAASNSQARMPQTSSEPPGMGPQPTFAGDGTPGDDESSEPEFGAERRPDRKRSEAMAGTDSESDPERAA